jgi:hypothetical protein
MQLEPRTADEQPSLVVRTKSKLGFVPNVFPSAGSFRITPASDTNTTNFEFTFRLVM